MEDTGKRRSFRHGSGDRVFYVILYLAFGLFSLGVLYPFLYVLALSLNDGMDALKGGITLWPRVFTIENYKTIFNNASLIDAVIMSVLRTSIGTVITIFLTIIVSYCFTKRDLTGYKFYMWFITIPMYVGAGLIPTYLLYRGIGISDSFLVYIVPNLVWASNIIIMRTLFESVPSSLTEVAVLDGAGHMTIIFRVIVPLSLPVVATMVLFNAVWHWNSWYDTVMFTRSAKLDTLMSLLTRMLIENQSQQLAIARLSRVAQSVTPTVLKSAMTIVTIVPILLVYPFLQKYFVKGVMIGAVKE